MRRILLGLCFLSFLNSASGQEIPLPEKMPQTHPRVLTTPAGKQETWKLIKKEEWAKDVFNKLKERTEVYTNLTDAQPASVAVSFGNVLEVSCHGSICER